MWKGFTLEALTSFIQTGFSPETCSQHQLYSLWIYLVLIAVGKSPLYKSVIQISIIQIHYTNLHCYHYYYYTVLLYLTLISTCTISTHIKLTSCQETDKILGNVLTSGWQIMRKWQTSTFDTLCLHRVFYPTKTQSVKGASLSFSHCRPLVSTFSEFFSSRVYLTSRYSPFLLGDG